MDHHRFKGPSTLFLTFSATSDNCSGFKKLAVGVLSWAIPLLAAPSGWAQSYATDCQTYSRVAVNQVDIGIGMKRGGVGAGCGGAAGPRWTTDKAEHFTWCLKVTPAERAAETQARRMLLMDCTRKRGAQKWPEWDPESWSTFSAGSGGFGGSEYGRQQCNNQGNVILDAAEKVRKDPTLLHDPVKDDSFYYSKYYHHFQHWTGSRCVLKNAAAGTTIYGLQGYTGSGATKPDLGDLGIKTQPPGSPDVGIKKPLGSL